MLEGLRQGLARMAFSAEWLALREAADASARSTKITNRLVRELKPRHELRVLDLGTGTGANLRYLAERIEAPRQDWLLVDHDARLLDVCIDRIGSWTGDAGGRVHRHTDGLEVSIPGRTCRVSTRTVDLAGVDSLGELFAGRDLVTASALLDLVSGSWLQAAAVACKGVGASVLFALTYDGRIHCDPADPADDTIGTLVNQHQHTDKGIGTAAGPGAASIARQSLEALGYEVHEDRADWVLTPGQVPLQRTLIEGWAEAAGAFDPARTPEIHGWRERRLEHLAAGRSTIVVGHRDLAGWIAGS